MARLLTRRKTAWANKFKPEYLRGNALTSNAGPEVRYHKEIDRLVNKMLADTDRSLRKFFERDTAATYFEAMDASVSSQARIFMNELIKKFDALFGAHAIPISENMVAACNSASSGTVHSSLAQLSGGLSLPTATITPRMKEIIKASTDASARLIKSIPQKYLTEVAGAVDRSITTGNGLQDLVPFLEKQKGITHRRAKNIAKDQTKKAYSNLSKQRMIDLGVEEYEWIHSGGGQEPRKLHQEYSGKIFRFDDPPVIDKNTGERGIPGQAINCGCKMRPVIRFKKDGE